jgi:hypothetical protein
MEPPSKPTAPITASLLAIGPPTPSPGRTVAPESGLVPARALESVAALKPVPVFEPVPALEPADPWSKAMTSDGGGAKAAIPRNRAT